MAELIPAPFPDLVTRLHREPVAQDALFELPRRNWYFPRPDDPDLSVVFHGRSAGNPAGPAAGPHTQMAQNLLLSYVAGGRILELKTVQVKDDLVIGRPCIDMANVGYNIEWSQELRVADSLREYAAGAMLIEMYRRSALAEGRLDGAAGDWIFDISVGYDLAGIRSEKVRGFLDGMRDAGDIVERLRAEIPRSLGDVRDAEYATHLSDSITLSTFHGCPADEIESICEFLIGECEFDVIVKMNPPTLGRERLEHLLYDVMGYTGLQVNPKAYGAAISFAQSVDLCVRLRAFAAPRGRRVGFKFSNTLEVINERDFFPAGNEIMYLSGQPLHVITMALTDAFRQAVGPDVPISFSAGIDKQNFGIAAACGFAPITMSTDLLRPGGYGRLPGYLYRLADEMKEYGAGTLADFMLRRFDQVDEARRRAAEAGHPDGTREFDESAACRAGLLNTSIASRLASEDPRYRASKNSKTPKRIDSHLDVFDCITCDKCLPVCPNAANFKYPTPKTDFEYQDLVAVDGTVQRAGEMRRFAIDRELQIACYADFCNECGNCDTFCPEYGGPYIEKPSFFGSAESWRRAAPRDGFYVQCNGAKRRIVGRIKGAECWLAIDSATGEHRFHDGSAEIVTRHDGDVVVVMTIAAANGGRHYFDMWAYHTLRYLLCGVLDSSRVNQVNVTWSPADTGVTAEG